MLIAASNTTGSITLQTSADYFHPNHVGVRLRIAGRRVHITAVTNAILATATVEDELTTTGPTADWDEAAFGTACSTSNRAPASTTRRSSSASSRIR
jgi:hypothetical protein